MIRDGKGFLSIIGLGFTKFIISVIGALVIGSLVTAIYSMFTKITYKNPNTEVILLLMCPLLAYVLADALLFSGVLAVMTSALLITRYCDYNCKP